MSFDFSCQLGTTLNGKPFRLSADQWSTHVAIVGPTGIGKSRLMWQMMREHRRQRGGFCCIDTGDLANDFLADAAAEIFMDGNYKLLRKLHYVKLNPFRMARYDPWKLRLPPGIDPEMRDVAARYLQHARVHSRMRVFQANTTGATDYLNQARRHRVLTNAFRALSTEVQRRRLAMEDVFIFFDPGHKRHKQVVDRIAPLLPSEIRRDIELLGGFRRLEDLRREVESSVNSVRMVLGEGLKDMLSGNDTDPCLDLQEIIERGDYLIVDAQQLLMVNHEQNVALASLIALDYCETAMNLPRAKRRKSTLFVDETPELLAPLAQEIGHWLRVLRKYGVSCCLSFQDLASMKRDEFDLAPVVLGQCGTIISFRSRWPSDVEILSRVLMTGNLSFEPLVHEVERHAGHEFLQIDELSETVKEDVGRSNTAGTTVGSAANQVRTATRSTVQNWADGANKQTVIGPHGHVVSDGRGSSNVRGGGFANSVADAAGSSQTSASTQSRTESETRGWALSVNHKIVPLPVIVREQQETGKLRNAVNDQFAQFMQDLHGLEQREAIVLVPGMKKAVEIVTAEVQDPFQSVGAQMKAVDAILRRLYETHDYYFQPSFDPEKAEKRIAEFIGEKEAQDADSPTRDGAPHERNGQPKPADHPLS